MKLHWQRIITDSRNSEFSETQRPRQYLPFLTAKIGSLLIDISIPDIGDLLSEILEIIIPDDLISHCLVPFVFIPGEKVVGNLTHPDSYGIG